MQLHFLGTSSGVPTKSRNVTAIALVESHGSGWFLVDCGEATQHQLLRSPLSIANLKGILITHLHGDHCYGLPGLLASAAMNGRIRALPVIAPKPVLDWISATQALTELYLPFELQLIELSARLDVQLSHCSISAVELEHRVPSFGYVFSELVQKPSLVKHKLEALGIAKGPLWGQLQAGKDIQYKGQQLKAEDFLESATPRKVIICGDNANPQRLAAVCADCQLLVHEATYHEQLADKARDYGHSYVAQVAQFAQSMAIPNLVLTHFSPRYQLGKLGNNSMQMLRSEGQGVYSGKLFLAEDLEIYQLDKAGELKLI